MVAFATPECVQSSTVKSMDNIETLNNSSEETYADISELNVTGGNGAKQADSPISISDDHESDYESYDETEMYENVNDNRNTPSSSPEHSQGKEVEQNEDISDTVYNETQSSTTSASPRESVAEFSVNRTIVKKYRKVRCSKLKSRRSSVSNAVDSLYNEPEAQKGQNEEEAASKTQVPIILRDSIVSKADFEVTLPENDSLLGSSAMHTYNEHIKSKFSETDSDESDSGRKRPKVNFDLKKELRDAFKCHECSEVFSDRYRLFKHSSIHKGDDLYRCDECEESFALPVILRNHKLNRHSLENKYVCNVCNKAYMRESYLKLHMNLHMKPTFTCDYNCGMCRHDYSSLQALKDHVINKHSDRKKSEKSVRLNSINICDIDKEMSNKTNSTTDRNDSDLCKNDTASLDAVRFPTSDQIDTASLSKLKVSMTQSTPKPKSKRAGYTCKLCDEVLESKSQLNQHMLKEHNESLFKCAECKLMLKTLANLKQHNKNRHSKENVACPVCSKVKVNDNLQREQTGAFKCHECLEGFSDRYRLFKHSSIHTGDNLYRCDECEEYFALPVILRNHKLNRHSSENKYVCNVCKKAYKRESHLKLHMTLHMKPKLTDNCGMCGHDYSSLQTLKYHVVNKHSDSKTFVKSIRLNSINKCDIDKEMSNKTNSMTIRSDADACKSDTSSLDVERKIPTSDQTEKASLSKHKLLV